METAGKHFGGVDNLLELTKEQKKAFFGSNESQTWNVAAQNCFQLVFKRRKDDVGTSANVLDALKYPYAVEISKRQWESVVDDNTNIVWDGTKFTAFRGGYSDCVYGGLPPSHLLQIS